MPPITKEILMDTVIVTQHPAAEQFIRRELPEFATAPVLKTATPDDVRGRVVAGNLPFHLAALAAEVIAVQFSGPPPRGREYGIQEMDAAGAYLARYRVEAIASEPKATELKPAVHALYSRVLAAAQKAARGLPTQPLADVVASHSATHWRGHSSHPEVRLPEGCDWDTPTVRLHGGVNGKRPIYLVGGRHLASGTHFGLQSTFQFVRVMTPDEPETNVRYYLRAFAERLLPAAELLRLGF